MRFGRLVFPLVFKRPSLRVRAAVLLLAFISVCTQAGAQAFGLSVTASTNPVTVSNSVAYSISVTNQTGFSLTGVFVTNAFSGPAAAQLVSATATQGFIATNSTGFLFSLGELINGGVAQMTVTVLPTTAGTLTNTVVVAALAVTNTAATNVVVQVDAPQTDLGVAITGPAGSVLVNDVMTYGVSVTNAGPNAAGNVVVSNGGFSFMNLLSITPTNQAFTRTNGFVVFNLGTLAAAAFRSFQFTVQPTNAGLLTLSASVGAIGVTDSNRTNDTATNNLTVGDFLTGQLLATNASTMEYKAQTGLMEQTVRLVNIGTNTVASARVIVSGLTNRLYNAVGTNNGNPFVVYGAALDPGQGVNLLLEYFVPTRLPITVPNSAYTAVEVPAVDLTAASVAGTNLTLRVDVATGRVLIEFPSIPDRSYTIFYSDNAAFTNALMAQPPIIAPADRVQWIDDGPPKTISHPMDASSRFYRVILNP